MNFECIHFAVKTHVCITNIPEDVHAHNSVPNFVMDACVSMYTCRYACIYVCVHIRMYVCIYIYMYIYIHTYA